MEETNEKLTTGSFNGIGIQVSDTNGVIEEGASAVFDSVVIKLKATTPTPSETEKVYTAEQLGTPTSGAERATLEGTSYKLTYSGKWQDVGFSLGETYNVEDVESITFNVSSQVGSLNLFCSSQQKVDTYF